MPIGSRSRASRMPPPASRAPPSAPPKAPAPPSPTPKAPAPPSPPPCPPFPPFLCPAPSAVGTPCGQGMFAVYIPTSTATGVAVGSGVGTTINKTMTGGFGGGHPEPSRPDVTHQEPYHQQQQQQACLYEQFVECAQNQSDLNLCAGNKEALKKCMCANGLSLEDML